MALYELHDLANLFPPMTDAEFSSLVDDVKKHGVREPITLFGGKVIEGRHRMLAAEEAGVELPFKDFDGDDAAALAFVLSANLHRRHLTDNQRAVIADKIANLGEGRPGKTASIEAVSQSDAAETMKVSRSAVQRAAEVRKHAVPELKEAVDHDDVSISAAAAVAKLPEDQQRAIVAEGPAAIVEAARQAREPEPVTDEWILATAAQLAAAAAVMEILDKRLRSAARLAVTASREGGIADLKAVHSILASKIIEALGELGGDDDFLDGILTEAFDAAS
jgi:hypothetical protein